MGSRYQTWDLDSEVGPSWYRFWNRGPMEVEADSGIETTWKSKWNRLRSC